MVRPLRHPGGGISSFLSYPNSGSVPSTAGGRMKSVFGGSTWCCFKYESFDLQVSLLVMVIALVC
jgi:hypothetical protein